ncbi:MAG: hypothetical protein M9894_39695 [Planctomycetes bacterium]|nr:hypothetical protein [Planctomycetota bacterium]
MVLRLVLPDDELARVERLRGVVPLVTRRTALVRELVRVGLETVEKEGTARLVRPAANKETKR